MSHGYIYIMTNPALPNMVKIGYAKDVDQRRKQLPPRPCPMNMKFMLLTRPPAIWRIRSCIK